MPDKRHENNRSLRWPRGSPGSHSSETSAAARVSGSQTARANLLDNTAVATTDPDALGAFPPHRLREHGQLPEPLTDLDLLSGQTTAATGVTATQTVGGHACGSAAVAGAVPEYSSAGALP